MAPSELRRHIRDPRQLTSALSSERDQLIPMSLLCRIGSTLANQQERGDTMKRGRQVEWKTRRTFVATGECSECFDADGTVSEEVSKSLDQ